MLASFSLLLCLALPQVFAASIPNSSGCKCIPGDRCWPGPQDWSVFNQTVNGRLVATEQLGSVCHAPNFNNASCQNVQAQWNLPLFQIESSSSILTAVNANNSCDAFTDPFTKCMPGNTVAYAVNATGPEEFKKAIAFAKARNLRFVIRNTGHDYMGKSTGKGALSIWTHHMKSFQFVNYTSPDYTGPAVKLGAGMQLEQTYRLASEKGFAVVGGACQSVGITGGYSQGGGHGPLMSRFGMGVDSNLEFEVVLASGDIVIANRQEHNDLYWALSGGGGGTYAAVLSLIVKAHRDFPVTTGVMLNFTANQDEEKVFTAIQHWHDHVPEITAAGGFASAEISNNFALRPLTLPGLNEQQAKDLLQPWYAKLDEAGITYNVSYVVSHSFYQHWNRTIRFNPGHLVLNGQYGGWQVSLDVVKNQGPALTAAWKEMRDAGCEVTTLALNVSTPVDNGVHAGWRDTALSVEISTPWPRNADLTEMKERARIMTEVCVPALSRLSPDTGAYLNEADPNQPDWQHAFWGEKYERLLEIKKKYDPEGIFYGPTTVGSERFRIDGEGRVCRV